MHEWGWFGRPAAALLFDWEEANEQILHKTISQNSECHDNIQEWHWVRIYQLLFRNQLVDGLFVKYANVLEHKVPGWHSSDDNTVPRLTERCFIRKVLPSENKSRLHGWCVVFSEAQEDEGHGVLVWCVRRWTLCGMFSRLLHQAQFSGTVSPLNLYKFTVLKN
jgi:hypothetical protein